MTTTALPRPAPGQALARGWALFWSSADRNTRWIVLLVAGGFIADALWDGGTPSLYPLALGVWWMWVPRIALVHREARQDNMPGIDGAVAWALLVALGTLLAAHAWSGNPVALANAVFWSALFLAVSLVSARRLLMAHAVALFVVLPAIAAAAQLSGIPVHAMVRAWLAGAPPLALVAPLAVAASLAAAWLWRGFLRSDIPGGEGAWSKPLLLMSAPGAHGAANHQFWTGMPFAAWMLKDGRGTAPRSDVDAMRRWIGHPFAPLTRRQQVARLIAFGVFAGFVLWLLRGGGRPQQFLNLFPVGLAMATAVFGVFIQRLHHLMQGRSAELAELALLPGWRSGEHATRLLRRAVWQTVRHEYAAILVMLSMLPLALWRVGALPPTQVAGQLLVAVEVVIALHAVVLAVLGGWRLRATPLDLAACAALVMVPACTLVVLGRQPAHWGALAAAWVAVAAGGALLLRRLAAGLGRRPHPFLQR